MKLKETTIGEVILPAANKQYPFESKDGRALVKWCNDTIEETVHPLFIPKIKKLIDELFWKDATHLYIRTNPKTHEYIFTGVKIEEVE